VYLQSFQEKYNLKDSDIATLGGAWKLQKEFENKVEHSQKLQDLRQLFNRMSNEIADSEMMSAGEQFSLLSLPKTSADIEQDLKAHRARINADIQKNIGSAERINKESNARPDTMVLYHIDDEFSGTEDENDDELTWAITLNKQKKRITVIFRGSTVKNDWKANVQIRFTDMKLHGEDSDEPTVGKVHQGFYKYLYGKTKLGQDGRDISKAEEILGKLHGLFADHKDYKLYVTGHSLGGASTLFSYRAAFDTGLPIKPVMNVSFASPFVGDQKFQDHFQALERDGLIRHLRVSNDDDVVPLSPCFGTDGWTPVLYKHVGLNVQFYKKLTMFRKSLLRISYPKPGDFIKGVSNAWSNNLLVDITFRVVANHSCTEYRDRLEAAKAELDLLPSLETLYRESYYTGNLNPSPHKRERPAGAQSHFPVTTLVIIGIGILIYTIGKRSGIA